MEHALEIVELRLHLSKFLTLLQLFECTLVCKNWNALFTPILYSTINIHELRKIPTVQTLEKYSGYVRSLALIGKMTQDYGSIHYRNIIELYLRVTGIASRTLSPDQLYNMILDNEKSLNRVSISLDQCHPDQLTKVWNALARCSEISNIRMNAVHIGPESLVPFVTICSTVRTLQMDRLDFDLTAPFIQTIESKAPFLNLNTIMYLGSGIQRSMEKVILELIKNSPNLCNLSWVRSEGKMNDLVHSDNLQEYRSIMIPRVYNNLKELTLSGGMSDSDISLPILAMNNALRAKMRFNGFGKHSYEALMENHSSTLTYLSLSKCPDVTSAMVQGLLSGCPNIKKFDADYIRGTDIVRVAPIGDGESENIVLGQDWVCLGLESLSLFFDMSSGDSNIDHSTPKGAVLFQRQQKLEQVHAFRQLSRLHALELLDIGGYGKFHHIPTLRLKLSSYGGELESLKTLKNLKTFMANTLSDEDSIHSLSWMKENWPRLKT